MPSISGIKKKLENLVIEINKNMYRLNKIFESACDSKNYINQDFNIISLMRYLEDLYLCGEIISNFNSYLNNLSDMIDELEKLANHLPGIDDAAKAYIKYQSKEKDYAAIIKELGSQKLFDKYLKLTNLHKSIKETDRKIMQVADNFCQEMIDLVASLNSDELFAFMKEQFYPSLANNPKLSKFIMPWLMKDSTKDPLLILSKALKCFHNEPNNSNNNNNLLENPKLRL